MQREITRGMTLIDQVGGGALAIGPTQTSDIAFHRYALLSLMTNVTIYFLIY